MLRSEIACRRGYAAITERIKLATGVTVLPLRNPLVAAKQIGTRDAFSGGGVILGVGVGWLGEEFEALGVPFKDRGRRHDDYLQAMKALWAQEKAAISNGFVDFRDAISRPRPAASVPVVVSGHSVRRFGPILAGGIRRPMISRSGGDRHSVRPVAKVFGPSPCGRSGSTKAQRRPAPLVERNAGRQIGCTSPAALQERST